MASRRLIGAVDWDDALVSYETGEWLPGALEWLRIQLGRGDQIIIHSCKANWPEGLAYLHSRLEEAGVLHPRLSIWHQEGKPYADYYLDDRVVLASGDWEEVSDQITAVRMRKAQSGSIAHLLPSGKDSA